MASGISPFQAWHGFAGASPLATALEAFEEIPPELVHTEWLQSLVQESQRIAEVLRDQWDTQAQAQARKHAELKPEKEFREGELVLFTRPFYEKGTGIILPQADGPYRIFRVLGTHTCQLVNALTGEPFLEGQRVSVARLIRFHYPADLVSTNVDPPAKSDIRTGALVAFPLWNHVYLGTVLRHFTGDQLELLVLHVAESERHGPWLRRRWSYKLKPDGTSVKEIVPLQDIICVVELIEDALTPASLEKLAQLDIARDMPRLDKALPLPLV